MAVIFLGYDVYRGYNVNESDLQIIARVTTKDANGEVDTIIADTDAAAVKVYRIAAVLQDTATGEEFSSAFSDKSVANTVPSIIDEKPEVVDTKLLALDVGKLDEGILA